MIRDGRSVEVRRKGKGKKRKVEVEDGSWLSGVKVEVGKTLIGRTRGKSFATT